MTNTNMDLNRTAYDFTFDRLTSGDPIDLSSYKESVILVVNTASKCGFTPQYKGLEALYQKYKGKGFVVIGVPSNDFGSQEFNTSEKIASFCDLTYGVTFPITSRFHVKGDKAHPFYLWAKEQLGSATTPKWNFHKYLINRQGKLVGHFQSKITPENESLIKAIEVALGET